MADARLTMLDVARRNAADPVVGLIDEVTTNAPEMDTIPGRTIKGTSYKTLHKTANPSSGFRAVNQGIEATKSTRELRTVETYVLDILIEADKAAAEANEDGVESFLAEEAIAAVESATITFGNQFYYGNVDTSNGFPGLQYMYDSSNYEVDATGTTASTGSSVYAVRFGPRAVQGIFGNDTTFQMADWQIHMATDADSKRFPAYYTTLSTWVGLQATTKTAIARIKNLTEDSGKGLTDDLVFKLLEKFPASQMPDVLFMSRRSLRQLRESRTATNETGRPAPLPEDVAGIRIVPTDSIVNTEAIA